ncbi:MAG: methylated-DNA--[protein]-cysteine S-methyltransferase [Acidobacteria bacterium]|nr:methylated-DNA--[protein]-cysteine S-methyltransferase [Acidobacteriota bacterium]
MPQTEYTRKVLAAVRRIPRGKVATYADVARVAGYPRAARGVASALRVVSAGVPWHRVLASGGRIALKGVSGLEQRFRLEAEGVKFRGRRVDMLRHHYTSV